MDKLTMTIIETRQNHTAARQVLATAKESLELVEAEIFMGCDYKSLGSNEAERKVRFDSLKRADPRWRFAARALAAAEMQRDATADTLAAAEDCRRAFENALKAAYLEKQFGFTVNPDSFDLFNLA